jgi:hypothetical protein
MDQSDPARDPLRSLAEAALARQDGTTPAGRRPGRRRPRPGRPGRGRRPGPDPRRGPTAGRRGVRGRGCRAGRGPDLDGGRTGQASATINEHVLVYHRTPVLWTRARAANSPLGESWWPTSDGTRPTGYRKLGPSLGLLLRCGCGQQLGYAPFTSLAEADQVLRRTSTDTCASWNPWETNYPHQGPKKETMKESNSSAQP